MATPIEVKVTPVSPDNQSTRGKTKHGGIGRTHDCHPNSDSDSELDSIPDRRRRKHLNSGAIPPSESLSNEKQPMDEYDFGDNLLNANSDKNSMCRIKTSTPLPHGPIIDLKGREVIFAIALFLFTSVSVGLSYIIIEGKMKEAERRVKHLNTTAELEICKSRVFSDEVCLKKECLEVGWNFSSL